MDLLTLSDVFERGQLCFAPLPLTCPVPLAQPHLFVAHTSFALLPVPTPSAPLSLPCLFLTVATSKEIKHRHLTTTGSNTPSSTSSPHLPASAVISSTKLSSLPSQLLETLLAFALGAECPARLPDATRRSWSRTQPAALKTLQDALRPKVAKRARRSHDTDVDPIPK